ncbi:alpha-beta hydrolase superfamily lysophospholipase [Rhizobium sp. BK512]|uniref:alpha/beta hydrolase family protein n=1 Tax=Rhizobium sp. BK512 TaxID=2587010 RepID=UPI00161376F3|nr:alpha/beta fold hydrolase [Rhizobium sp. BK512]MBB3560320.1 alpha-beta hydrolase superfamily lysophospholipase [Rhizobium sp. BK512]
MSMLFRNELHEDFGSWPIAYIPYGGADFGEIRAVAEAVGDGDDGAFYQAWISAGDRLKEEAEAALSRGHKVSARELYLRASVFYAASYHPLYGAPVDPRLLSAFRKQTDALERGLALSAPTIEPLAIPFGKTPMPGYFVPAQGLEHEVRPIVIFNNGYDCTITDTYFACAVAASRRGYHSLLFDGPGQGAMLYEHGIPLRPDWDVVIRAVVDFAVNHPLVDPDRIALSGWSLGGLLAPRGAAGELRIAALIADPGTWSIADGFRRVIIQKFGVPAEAAADLGALGQKLLDTMDAFVRANPVLNWKVVQRGFWVHGVDNLRAFLASAELFTMRGHAERIQCPTLITHAENDGLAADAGFFFAALRCPKTLMRFTAAEGADGHCEMKNRSLLNRRVLDWLDKQFRA